MRKTALLIAVALASAALGGTASGLPGMPGRAVTTDGFVTKTTGTMALYVDPLGSDNNTCTGTLTNACATLTGAFSKVPQFVNHAVTIGVAGAADGGIATIAMQDGGTDISIDSVTYTVTQLNAASPTWLPTTFTPQGSKVWK